MTKPISGSLYVESYTGTENPGEYSFENGLFTNLNDSGNGAYDISPGFVIYIPATNINTGTVIAGVSNRYLLTSVSVIDTTRVSGVILWDGVDVEEDAPTPGVFSIITQTTPNLKLGIPPVDNNYFDLTPGSTLSALLNDVINIMDRLGGSTPNFISSILPVTTNGQNEFILQYAPKNKTATMLTVNGINYAYGETYDFIIYDTVLTWTGLSLTLDVTDVVVVSYYY